ncbi:hypothetical protein FDECE_18491 [Fusarium decemcellulare]|nr:hypothetical protein FDECE_18491 [Fusarium decemcellulare]
MATPTQQMATGSVRHALQLPGSDPEDPVVDMLVTQMMKHPQDHLKTEKIGRLIRKENHADVYSVHDPFADFRWTNLEARAFILDGIPAKLKRYRKRCIKRLEGRVYLDCRCRGAFLVVYFTDKIFDSDNDDESEGNADGAGEENGAVEPRETEKTEPMGRSAAKDAFWKRGSAHPTARKAPSKKETEQISEKPRPLSTIGWGALCLRRACIMLYLAYDEEGELRSLAPLDLPDVFINTPTMRAWANSLESHRLCLTCGLKDLEDISWVYNTRMFLLKGLELKVCKMEYRQLFSGIHFALSRQADAGALNVLVKGINPRREVLQHVGEVLPLLVDDAEEACVELYEKFEELDAKLASTAEVERGMVGFNCKPHGRPGWRSHLGR